MSTFIHRKELDFRLLEEKLKVLIEVNFHVGNFCHNGHISYQRKKWQFKERNLFLDYLKRS